MKANYLGVRTDRQNFEKKFIKNASGCWNWIASMNSKGYGGFRYNKIWQGAHRVSWMLYVGVIPIGLAVLHKCNSKSCVNPDHLYVGTISDNTKDSVRAGTHHPGATISKSDVVCILRMLRDRIPQWLIAWTYKISASQVSRINTRSSWVDVSIKDAI